MDANQVIRTVETLRAIEHEQECVEFKHNNSNPEDIGEYISVPAARHTSIRFRDTEFIRVGS